MSYTIMYGRTFIKTTRGIIPMVLTGSNNCTMFYGGKEILERDWSAFRCEMRRDPWVELPAEVLMEKVRAAFKEDYPDCWKRGSEWINNRQAVKFFERAIKEAQSIEEIFANNLGQSLRCSISYWGKESNSTYLEKYCHTTTELEAWIDEAKAFEKTLGKGDCYYDIRFSGIKPLKSPQREYNEPVVLKYHNNYVTKISDRSIGTNKDVQEALVYNSSKEAQAAMQSCYFRGDIKIVRKPEIKNKPYAIVICSGGNNGDFVMNKTARRVRICRKVSEAKSFATESQAQKYINEKLGGFPCEFLPYKKEA